MKFFKTLTCLTLFAAALSGCGGEAGDKHDLLMRSIDAMELGAESRSLSAVMEYVDENYSDAMGRRKADVARAVQINIMRNQQLHVLVSVNQIEWVDDGEENARVELVAALAGRPIDKASLLDGVRADLVRFNVNFHRDGERYLVTSAEWQRALMGADLF